MGLEIIGKTIFGSEFTGDDIYGTYKDYTGLTYSTELSGIGCYLGGGSASAGAITTTNESCKIYLLGGGVTCWAIGISMDSWRAGGYVQLYPENLFLKNYDTPFSITITYTYTHDNALFGTRAEGNVTGVNFSGSSGTATCILSYDGINKDVTWDGTLIDRNNSFSFRFEQIGGTYMPSGTVYPSEIKVTSGKVKFLKTINI